MKKSYEPTRYFEHKQSVEPIFNNLSMRSQSHILMHSDNGGVNKNLSNQSHDENIKNNHNQHTDPRTGNDSLIFANENNHNFGDVGTHSNYTKY